MGMQRLYLAVAVLAMVVDTRHGRYSSPITNTNQELLTIDEFNRSRQTWTLHKYASYDQYVKVQEEGNIKKIHQQFVTSKTISGISRYIGTHLNLSYGFALCHGTRQGNEQKWFKEEILKYTNRNMTIIGTEISSTATQFPDTIQWDYHKAKPEWSNAVDFIYSNTLDHSFDPALAISTWMSCVNREEGAMFIHYTSAHSIKGATKLDPFGATAEQYKALFLANGKYVISDVLNLSSNDKIFVVRHKRVSFG